MKLRIFVIIALYFLSMNAAEYDWVVPVHYLSDIFASDQKYRAYEVDGVTFYLDDIDDCIKNVLKQHIPWEREIAAMLKKYAVEGSVALDIGAHIGTHAITLSKLVGPKGKVVCVEPQRKIFQELCRNLAVNNCKNVIALHCAAGEKHDTCYLGEPVPNNEGARYIVFDGDEKVRQITIDSLDLMNVSLIKMDVENREEYVLAGCQETIKRCKPVILIEIRGNKIKSAQDRENIEDMKNKVLEQIRSYGYEVSHFTGDDYIALPK